MLNQSYKISRVIAVLSALKIKPISFFLAEINFQGFKRASSLKEISWPDQGEGREILV